MTSTADFLDVADNRGDALLDDLKQIIALGSKELTRNQQVELGPSEVGTECMKRLALGMLEAPHCNPDYDCLPSLFGTAMHTWFSWAVARANLRLGRVRWVSEQRVQARPGGLGGTCDLFDIDTLTVVDLKAPGPTRYKKYTGRKGPPIIYRKQVHIYAYGYWQMLGIMPQRVAIFWLPRAGTLHQARLWIEPFQPREAEEIFAQMDNIALVANDLGLEHNFAGYDLIPATPSEDCLFCPFFSPDPQNPRQCKGHIK